MASRAQDITRHFRGDWRGSYGLIPTPGHSAKDRGTKVCDTDDGDVVFNSFNGGDWREVRDECRRASLLPDRPERDQANAWRETGHYEYRAADGTLLYRTVRREKPGKPKQFMAQRPDGRGGWTNGLPKDVRRVLYRLPELAPAISRAARRDEDLPTVFLVEGERKADKLASWGLLATAVAFGAQGWRADYAEDLAGCTVVILPDNDEPGRGFADRARKDLEAQRARIAVVDLPGLPLKGDIIDWRGTKDELLALVKATTDGDQPEPETFPLADLSAWASTPPEPKRFLMSGFLPEREVTLFTGAGGTNKSTFGLQLCACAAAGLPMLGVPVAACPSLYITAEDDDQENHWRLTKIARTLGTSLERLKGRLGVVSLRGRLNNELATFDAEGRIHVEQAYRTLRVTLEKTGARLLVLDNVGHLFVGNENDRGQVTGFVNLLYQLCRELDVTVVLIAHPNKAGDSYSGSTAWLNAVRSQIVLQRPEGNPDPDARLLTLGKANYARPDQQIAFRWHDFALVLDTDLSEERRAEIAANVAASGDNAAFLACLEERTRDGLVVSPNVSPNYAPSQFKDMPAAQGIGKERLRKAMERLLSLGTIEVFDHENRGKGRSVKALRIASPDVPGRFPGRFPNASRTDPRTLPDSTTERPRTHTPLLRKEGAGPSEAPPHLPNSFADDRPRTDRGGMILAPGESADDPIPGWDDLDMENDR